MTAPVLGSTSPDPLPRLAPGTRAWFEMVGRVVCDTAGSVGLPADLDLSMVERYSDGAPLPDGPEHLVQGIRIDVVAGRASFRVGVGAHETADVTVVVTADGARRLNGLVVGDPAHAATREALLRSGELRVEGDPSPLAAVLAGAHDPIVHRTLPAAAR